MSDFCHFVIGIIVRRPSLKMDKEHFFDTCINMNYENNDKNELFDLGSNVSVCSSVLRCKNNLSYSKKNSFSHQNINPIECYCEPSSIKHSIHSKCNFSLYNNINKELLTSRISTSLNEGIDMPKYLLGYDRIVREDIAAENSRSLQNLEYVHTLQKGRMKNRSQWFLNGKQNIIEDKPEKINTFNENGNKYEKINDIISIVANDNITDDQKKLNEETSKSIKKYNKIVLTKTLSDKPILLSSVCNSTSGIERRSSWKKHYFRAQKSLDSSIETNNNINEDNLLLKKDKPIRRISTLTGLTKTIVDEDDNLSKRNKITLVRRKSSSSMKNKSSNYYPTSKLIFSKN
uniref:Rho-GAP domain-containing protein n=1 Tax=Strongyloides stercoralis TaxID=6248 RepID=A0AAF5DR63_STRER